MRLIEFAVLIAVSLALAPVAAEAQQQAEKVYRVGCVAATPTATPHLSADRTEAIILSPEPLDAQRDRCVRYIDRMRRLR